MQTADIILTISVLFSALALVIAGITYFATRQYFHREVNHRLTERIYEINRLNLRISTDHKIALRKIFA